MKIWNNKYNVESATLWIVTSMKTFYKTIFSELNSFFWILIDVINQMLKNHVNHYWLINICNVVEMNKKLNAKIFFINIDEEIKHFTLFVVQSIQIIYIIKIWWY